MGTTMLNHPTQDLMHSLGFEGSALGLAGGERQPGAKGFRDLQNDPLPRSSTIGNGSACCSAMKPRHASKSASNAVFAPPS